MGLVVFVLNLIAASCLVMAALRVFRIAGYRLKDIAVAKADYAYFAQALVSGFVIMSVAYAFQIAA